jgi:hypothetical protein
MAVQAAGKFDGALDEGIPLHRLAPVAVGFGLRFVDRIEQLAERAPRDDDEAREIRVGVSVETLGEIPADRSGSAIRLAAELEIPFDDISTGEIDEDLPDLICDLPGFQVAMMSDAHGLRRARSVPNRIGRNDAARDGGDRPLRQRITTVRIAFSAMARTPHVARRTLHAARCTPHVHAARCTLHAARSTQHDSYASSTHTVFVCV